MPLARNTYVIGTHIYFFPEGAAYTLLAPSTCGRESKPDATDPKWYDLGIIESAEDNLSDTEIEVFKPSPGKLRLYDILSVKEKMTIKFTTDELSPIALQATYRSQALTEASAQFNPLAGQVLKGWLKVQRYNQLDDQAMLMDVFCRLKLSSALKFDGGALVKPEYEALVLQSTQNTAAI